MKVCSPPPKFTLPSSKGIPPTLTLTISSIKASVSTPAVLNTAEGGGGTMEGREKVEMIRRKIRWQNSKDYME